MMKLSNATEFRLALLCSSVKGTHILKGHAVPQLALHIHTHILGAKGDIMEKEWGRTSS